MWIKEFVTFCENIGKITAAGEVSMSTEVKKQTPNLTNWQSEVHIQRNIKRKRNLRGTWKETEDKAMRILSVSRGNDSPRANEKQIQASQWLCSESENFSRGKIHIGITATSLKRSARWIQNESRVRCFLCRLLIISHLCVRNLWGQQRAGSEAQWMWTIMW